MSQARRDIVRRTVLKGGALLLSGCATSKAGGASGGPAATGAPIVDTHVHCFAGVVDARFPYHAGAPYRPEPVSSPEQLLACMDGAGVTAAVIVHPEPYQDDHRYLEHCLHVGGDRLTSTVLVFCDRPGSAETLPDLTRRMRVAAVRIHAYHAERLPPFGSAEMEALWKSAADLGLMVQLHFEPRYAPGFQDYITRYPGTTVIIDHLGRPFQGTPEEHAVVMNWADLPNTVIKLSALSEPSQYPHADARPVVRSIVQRFGPGRVIQGGGFGPGATGESYRASRESRRALLDFLSPDEQAQILGMNAYRLFGFGARSAG